MRLVSLATGAPLALWVTQKACQIIEGIGVAESSLPIVVSYAHASLVLVRTTEDLSVILLGKEAGSRHVAL